MEQRPHNKIRKSLLMSWTVCPRQAWESIRDVGYGEYNTFNLENPALLLGQIFHKEMDSFYTKIDMQKLLVLAIDKDKSDSDKLAGLAAYCFSVFSPTTHEQCLEFFHWYAEEEAKRFLDLYKNHNAELWMRFLPVYVEKYIESQDDENGITRNGHFDRLDWIGPKKLRIVEYKTGKSYDVTKSYKLTKLRLELYYYKWIIERLKEFEGYEVVEWMLVNPTLKVTFISKFSPLTRNKLQTSVQKLTEDINSSEKPKRELNFYCEGCKFKQGCLINVDKNIYDIE